MLKLIQFITMRFFANVNGTNSRQSSEISGNRGSADKGIADKGTAATAETGPTMAQSIGAGES